MPKFCPSNSTRAGTCRSLAAGAALLLGACSSTGYEQGSAPAYVSEAPPAPAYYPETPALQPVADPLDQLMAPIALYPDPLISLILPAAAFPSDIAAAGAYFGQGGDAGQVDNQPWDPSVRSLAHYPSVVAWMAQNESWTQTVGSAFVSEPAEVMTSIQRLRELARAAGTLTDSPEQQVIVDGSYVEIEPAQPGVIYVPRYDPAIVFVDQPYYGFNGPFLAFGPAYRAGAWLTYGCNWGGGGIVIVDANYWHGDRGWWHPNGPGGGGFSASANFRAWSFPANRPRPQAVGGWQNRAQSIQPRLAVGLPTQPPASAFRNIRTRGPAAVVVPGRNPAAFKGRPVNNAIFAKSPDQHTQRGMPDSRPEAARPPANANRSVQAAPASRPVTTPQKATEPARGRNAEKAPAPAAPDRHIERGTKGPEAKPAGGHQADKKETKQPDKSAKPAPKDEKPKDEKSRDQQPSQ